MDYAIEFRGTDGKLRRTRPMSKIAAEIALTVLNFEAKIVPIQVKEIIVGELYVKDVTGNQED